MSRPSRDQVCMEVAFAFSNRGTCNRARVGAAITRDGRILATGYNGPPAGLPHCDDSCENRHAAGCSVAVHAESNAIAYAARYGIAVAGATIFSTHQPCLGCSQLIVNSGIARVVYNLEYRDNSGLELLKNAGLDIMRLI